MSRLRIVALAAGLAITCGAALPARAGRVARVTWYPIGVYSGTMADGQPVYEGAFACPRAYLLHTVTIVEAGITGLCEDTGDPGYFDADPFKVDVAAYSRPWWMRGDYFTVEVE